MIINDFICEGCSHVFEYYQKDIEDVPDHCPKCNQTKIKKVISYPRGGFWGCDAPTSQAHKDVWKSLKSKGKNYK